MGFQLGLSYAADVNAGDNDPQNRATGGRSLWAAAATYENKFGDVGLKLGLNTESVGRTSNATSQGQQGHKNYAGGAQLSYMGFTLSGGYATTLQDTLGVGNTSTQFDSRRYMVGLEYATGPYVVGVWHFNEENQGQGVNTSAIKGNDEVKVTSVYGSYLLNDGIKLEGMVFNVDYDQEEIADSSEFDGGWGIVAGFRLDF
jgi:hypothetical protein